MEIQADGVCEFHQQENKQEPGEQPETRSRDVCRQEQFQDTVGKKHGGTESDNAGGCIPHIHVTNCKERGHPEEYPERYKHPCNQKHHPDSRRQPPPTPESEPDREVVTCHGTETCSAHTREPISPENPREENGEETLHKVEEEYRRTHPVGSGHLETVQGTDVAATGMADVNARLPMNKEKRSGNRSEKVPQQDRLNNRECHRPAMYT